MTPTQPYSVSGNLVDIPNKRIYGATLWIEDGHIKRIESSSEPINPALPYIMPGFIDSHVHIESSMLVPSEFARLAVLHGTIGTISDPHEIANVCGVAGVEFMIENGNQTPFKFFFGAPSCVPATIFETAGAEVNEKEVDALLGKPEIYYLSEMMNFPGVLHNDPVVMAKIKSAQKHNKPVDGHAPGLRGEAAKKYINAGISTDHECFTIEEALEKLDYGMHIIIREGSAAKNFEALYSIIDTHTNKVMLCTDDKHPDSLAAGHINTICARALAKGLDVFNILQTACINPVKHYKLPVGLLNPGDAADFILVKDLVQFEVTSTYINGELVAQNGISNIRSVPTNAINNFNCEKIEPTALIISENEYPNKNGFIPVIEALDGQLITNKLMLEGSLQNGNWVTDTENDILKIVVVNRYHTAPIAKAFIKNFGLTHGAIASSVAHDSHNIVAVGVDDASITAAINVVIEAKGGVSVVDGTNETALSKVLPLPVAGLMSAADGFEVASTYTAIDLEAKALGSKLEAPFMTLSFMALLVIPHLKLSDKGLFNGDDFNFDIF
ncbi:MAG: adenine deaminase [Bacteroidota bacterium]|jgi:adenine deaminase